MLLDTSGLFSLLHQAEPHHRTAHQYYATARVRITHSLILAELVALCTVRKVKRGKSLAFVQAVLGNADIEVVWADEILLKQALQLLTRRKDKNYSWCDATSFVLMSDRALSDALTTDRHFDQEGFHRLLT